MSRKNIRHVFAQRLRERRSELGISTREIASFLNTTINQYNKYEYETAPVFPRPEKLVLIGQYLRIGIDELLDVGNCVSLDDLSKDDRALIEKLIKRLKKT